MADDQGRKGSDDWLKVLSLLALMSTDLPDDRQGSAVIAAMVIVGLSIYWSAFSKFLYVLATGFLIWFAFVNPVTPVICFAVMYTVLGIVMFAKDERRLVGKGHFLGALWWAGQAVVHLLSIHFARLDFSETGFFTDLFLVISICMMIREAFRGGWHLFRDWRVPTAELVDDASVIAEHRDRAA